MATRLPNITASDCFTLARGWADCAEAQSNVAKKALEAGDIDTAYEELAVSKRASELSERWQVCGEERKAGGGDDTGEGTETHGLGGDVSE